MSAQKRKRSEESPLVKEDSTKPLEKSILDSSEVSFPRGGASILTPLELKEVSNEAVQDVLFGKDDGKPAGVDGASEAGPLKKKKKAAKKLKKSAKGDAEDDDDEIAIPVETLNFKSLIPGTLVLGQVSAINKLEIVLSLADNLNGYVPITSISSTITSILEEVDESDSESEEEEDDDEETTTGTMKPKKRTELPDLSKIFKIGQWLRAVVVESDKQVKNQKRIQLSIEPEEVNKVLEDEDLDVGVTVQVAVKSIEDHGLILSTGKEGINGFITNKDLKNSSSLLNVNELVPGAVFLSTIFKRSGRTLNVKLQLDLKKSTVSTISSIDAIVPGNLIDALVVDVTKDGLVTRSFGLVDSTVSLAHLHLFNEDDIKHKYAVGSTFKARILATLFKNASKKLVLTTLPPILNLQNNQDDKTSSNPLEAFPIGHVFDNVEVLGFGNHQIYVKIDDDRFGEVFMTRVDEDKQVDISAYFPTGSKHPARVLGYSTVDGYYILTMESKLIKQSYLRPQDIPVGELVTGEIISVSGEHGLKVKIFDQFEATVPIEHMSDIKLVYPERKFKIAQKVKGRVLKIQGKKIILTLKKSLISTENIISEFEDAKLGDKTTATVVKFLPNAAIVAFFGNVSALLPKSEISETVVRNPKDYLKLNQTVSVRVISVDEASKRLVVSCKLYGETSESQNKELSKLVEGKSMLKVSVVEKLKESVIVEDLKTNLKGVIFVGHLSDGNYEQNRVILKKLEVGSQIEGLVIATDDKNKIFNLTLKETLIKAAKDNKFPSKYQDIKISDDILYGFIRSITPRGVFVSFAGKLVGLVLPRYATAKPVDDLNLVFRENQSISVKVVKVDDENQRFLCSIKDAQTNDVINPVDPNLKTIEDFAPGKITKAVIKSVNPTNLELDLADNLQGIIDISQIFDDIKEIKNVKNPLKDFKPKKTIDVKIIGYHNSYNNTFTNSFDYKSTRKPILELSIKKSDLVEGINQSVLPNDITVGSTFIAFIKSYSNGFIWCNISPNIKARLSLLELAKIESVDTIEKDFPVGSALRVTIRSNQNNLITIGIKDEPINSYEQIKVGDKLPARVVKVSDGYVVVELGDSVTAISKANDAILDHGKPLSETYQPHEIVIAKVLSANGDKVSVSLRKSENAMKSFSSSSASSSSKSTQLKRGDVVKGFVKTITDKGVFIGLSNSNEDGYVRISELSDAFVKDWKSIYKLNQHVDAKVLESNNGRISLTLKPSIVKGENQLLKPFSELKVDEVYEGFVKRVTDFGVFVSLDGTNNVSGLCHRSNISDNAVFDIQALFGEGDRVKVKILSIDSDKKQLSLGMKASLFENDESNDEEDSEDEDVEVEDSEDSSEDNSEQGSEEEDEIMEDAFEEQPSDQEDDESDSEDEDQEAAPTGLSTNGFDWTASILDQANDEDSSDDDDEDFTNTKSKKKKSKKFAVEDITGDINSQAPQSVSDFERLIIGNPNSSVVWMNYMSFQLQLSEIEKAREIGERALKTIGYREEAEKLNIWIALLNLENTFGTEETLEDTFKRSTEYMDSLTMHHKMVSIYILSEKFDKADKLFKVMIKKFGRSSVSTWVLYGNYLLDREENEKCHEILGDALHVLPKRDHIEVVRKFAQMEFNKGDAEQGRTLFEGLISDAPKRIDLWNVYIDQEIKLQDKRKVEDLFERVLTKKVSRKQAKFFFSKWLSFEEKFGDEKMVDYVKAKAQDYVKSNE